MIKVKGKIPARLTADYLGKVYGTQPTQLDQVPLSKTTNYTNNRTPLATDLTKRFDARQGFDWYLYGAPLVAKRPDGSFQIYDGGHRIAMFEIAFPDATHFPALVSEVKEDKVVPQLFHKINGTASKQVSPNVRFISQILGEEHGLQHYKDVILATKVVVSEDANKTNYVLSDIIDPDWRIDSNALIFLTNKDKQTAIDCLKLYTQSFSKNAGKDKLAPVTSQIVKALQCILLTYQSHFIFKHQTRLHFFKWFKDATQLNTQVKSWLFNEKYQHDRMEQRHLGTALGIIQMYASYCRSNNVPAPEVKVMENLFKAREQAIKAKLNR